MKGKGAAAISVFGAFALSIGTAIGWGSFVVTGSSFLCKAGPAGSILGLLIGFLIMVIVAVNYSYMINKYPMDNGGIFCYAKNTLGGDHAFLVSWFLVITYLAILCANLSSLSLFARYVFGDIFQFGPHYSIGGYHVWFSEILLPLLFIAAFGGICLLKKSVSTKIQFALAFIFITIINTAIFIFLSIILNIFYNFISEIFLFQLFFDFLSLCQFLFELLQNIEN